MKKVENIVSKGEIARFEQFLLSQCFQKSSAAKASESIYIRERVNQSLVLKSLFDPMLLVLNKNSLNETILLSIPIS